MYYNIFITIRKANNSVRVKGLNWRSESKNYTDMGTWDNVHLARERAALMERTGVGDREVCVR